MVGRLVTGRDPLDEASAWVARLQARSEDPGERRLLREWLDDSPENERAFDRATSTWDLLGVAAVEDSQFDETVSSDWHVGRRALISGSLLSGMFITSSSMIAVPALAEIIETGVGEQKKVTLADGTTAQLDVCTRLDVAFSGKSRQVHLVNGHVDLAVKTGTQPLEIKAGDCVALSQRSRIELARSSPHSASVTVVSGAVRLASGQDVDHVILTDGQRLIESDGAASIDRPDLSQLLSWQDGYVAFDDQTLTSVAARMNGYSEVKVMIGADVAGLKLSGRFAGRDTESFVQSVAALLPVSVRREGGHFLISSRTI